MTMRVLATVECRCEAVGDENPVAVHFGEDRIAVAELVSDAVVGSVVAGERTERRALVRLENGELLELQRHLPDGEWRVFRP